MDRKLSSKLLQLEEQFSKLMSLQYGNGLCKKVIPWREEFKTFWEVINDKKNKEELKYFNKDEKLDWLEDVKKLVDDVKKILDEIVIIVKTSSQKRSIFAFCRNPIADTAFTDTRRIAETSKRIDRLKTKMYAIGLQVGNKSVPCSGPELCKPAGLPNSDAIYGRDVTDHESDLDNFSIMPVIGMAGIGKPTLALLECNDEAVEAFKPEESDVSRISKAILETVTSKSCHLKDINDLAASILAGLLYTLSGLMNDKANLMGDPECFKGEIIGGSGNTKLNWSKEICVC